MPMPKDILPILSKDADKQKAIEESAAKALEVPKAGPRKSELPPALAKSPDPAQAAKLPSSKKILMNIQQIPPFNPSKPKVAPPTLPIAETAKDNIALAPSPTPSHATEASSSQAKLNPNANSFVFKPSAPAFKPVGVSVVPKRVSANPSRVNLRLAVQHPDLLNSLYALPFRKYIALMSRSLLQLARLFPRHRSILSSRTKLQRDSTSIQRMISAPGNMDLSRLLPRLVSAYLSLS